MTRQGLDITLNHLGLDVPEAERNDIAAASVYLLEMIALVRKPREVGAEPAHVVNFSSHLPDNQS